MVLERHCLEAEVVEETDIKHKSPKTKYKNGPYIILALSSSPVRHLYDGSTRQIGAAEF